MVKDIKSKQPAVTMFDEYDGGVVQSRATTSPLEDGIFD